MASKRPLEAADLTRLQRLCGMFGSDHDGERSNAAALADRYLRDRGWRWCDVLTAPRLAPPKPPEPDPADWQGTVAACLKRAELNAWERDFLTKLACYDHPPSERQRFYLARIAARFAR